MSLLSNSQHMTATAMMGAQCILAMIFRLVKSEVEVEMEIESADGGEPQMVITTEEEEEVVLFWNSGSKSKPIRDLSSAYQDGNMEDKAILDYYR